LPRDARTSSRGRGCRVETSAGGRIYEQARARRHPAIVADLVASGERIYGVQELRSDLEDVYLEVIGGRGVTGVFIVVGYAIREAIRRRVFVVVLILTAGSSRSLCARRGPGVRGDHGVRR
jgi:hypothetical protein